MVIFALGLYSPLNSIRSILTSEIMIALEQFSHLAQAQYTRSRSGPDAAFCISQLTAEVLVAPDDDYDDPFLTSDDDENELEANELAVFGT